MPVAVKLAVKTRRLRRAIPSGGKLPSLVLGMLNSRSGRFRSRPVFVSRSAPELLFAKAITAAPRPGSVRGRWHGPTSIPESFRPHQKSIVAAAYPAGLAPRKSIPDSRNLALITSKFFHLRGRYAGRTLRMSRRHVKRNCAPKYEADRSTLKYLASREYERVYRDQPHQIVQGSTAPPGAGAANHGGQRTPRRRGLGSTPHRFSTRPSHRDERTENLSSDHC